MTNQRHCQHWTHKTGNEDKQSKKCNITQKIKKMSSTYSIEKQVVNLDANRCNAASCFRFIVKRIPRHFMITSTWARNSLLCCLCLYHSNAINVLRGHSLIVLCLSAILSAKSPVVAAVSKSETTDAIVVKLTLLRYGWYISTRSILNRRLYFLKYLIMTNSTEIWYLWSFDQINESYSEMWINILHVERKGY
jgi:hypothetical protein